MSFAIFLARIIVVALFFIIVTATLIYGSRWGARQITQRRRERTPGSVQRQFGAIRRMFFVFGIFALIWGIVGLTSQLSLPASSRNTNDFRVAIGALVVAVLLFLLGYFFWGYQVTATPDAITVKRPYFGTSVITHQNFLSAEPRASGTGRFLIVRFREGAWTHRVKLDIRAFDLTDFFKGQPKLASILAVLEDIQHLGPRYWGTD